MEAAAAARRVGPNAANDEALAAVKTPADSAKLPFGLRAQLASAAPGRPTRRTRRSISICPSATSSRPCSPDGRPTRPSRFSISNLRQYRALAIDVGDQDGLRVDAGKLHDALTNYGIANEFEIYPGTHTSDVAVRFREHVIPFFSRTLSFEPVKR